MVWFGPRWPCLMTPARVDGKAGQSGGLPAINPALADNLELAYGSWPHGR